MEKILVVEDSPMVMKILRHVLAQSDQIQPVYAVTFEDARKELAENQFAAALVDLSLPDAPNGEVVDFVLQQGVPCVVLTGSFDERKREQLLAKGVADYVTKEGRYSYQYALGVIHRLIKNRKIKVLVVDDSDTQRAIAVNLLNLHMFDVLEAKDGVHAIKLLLETPEIKLLITDYNMPRMGGVELVQNIRVKYEKTDLIIIGLSTEGEASLSAKFIKAGANDFLRKPFNHEEFHCRISHNIEFLELIESIKDSVSRDGLTGTYTRSYFFSQGETLLLNAREKGSPVAAAVIELENFSEVNSLYGHEAADLLLKYVGKKFVQSFGRFIVARGGSKEFFVLMPALNNEKARAYVDEVRQILGRESVSIGSHSLSLSFSAGVSNRVNGSMDSLMGACVECLKRAKEAGGDLVFGDDE